MKMIEMRSVILVVAVMTMINLGFSGNNILAYASKDQVDVVGKMVTLDDICANRQVPIVSVSDMRRFIIELEARPEACDQSFRSSLHELGPILATDNQPGGLCGEQKFKQVVDYHFRFINPPVEQYKSGDHPNEPRRELISRPLHEEKFDESVKTDEFNQVIMIPISVQQFFKAWALQVSGLCKLSLVKNLPRAVETKLDPSDLEMVKEFASEKTVIESLGPKEWLQTFLFAGLVDMPDIEEGDGHHKLLKEAHIKEVVHMPDKKRMLEACKKRFRPIYSKLVLPVVRLAKLGYDYVGSKMEPVNNAISSNDELRTWLTLTSVCENLVNARTYSEETVGNYSSGESLPDLQEPNNNNSRFEEISFTPTFSYEFQDRLWIVGSEALAKELARIRGFSNKGFDKFLFRMGVLSRKAAATLDPHNSAFYRRNQDTIGNGLNTVSILSSITSILTSVAGRRR